MSVSGESSGENQGSVSSISHKLTSKTPFLSLKLYAVIAILVLCVLATVLLIFLSVRTNRISRKRKMRVKHSSGLIPLVSKEIVEIKATDRTENCEMKEVKIVERKEDLKEKARDVIDEEVDAGRGKSSGESDVSGGSRSDASVEPQNIGWGRWYSLRELEMATRGFADENVIGEGGYGIVYKGVLQEGSVVAVKNLLNNKYFDF